MKQMIQGSETWTLTVGWSTDLKYEQKKTGNLSETDDDDNDKSLAHKLN